VSHEPYLAACPVNCIRQPQPTNGGVSIQNVVEHAQHPALIVTRSPRWKYMAADPTPAWSAHGPAPCVGPRCYSSSAGRSKLRNHGWHDLMFPATARNQSSKSRNEHFNIVVNLPLPDIPQIPDVEPWRPYRFSERIGGSRIGRGIRVSSYCKAYFSFWAQR